MLWFRFTNLSIIHLLISLTPSHYHLSLTIYHSLSHPLSLSHSLSITLSLYLTHSLTLSLYHTRSKGKQQQHHPLSHSLYYILTLYLTHSLTISFINSVIILTSSSDSLTFSRHTSSAAIISSSIWYRSTCFVSPFFGSTCAKYKGYVV